MKISLIPVEDASAETLNRAVSKASGDFLLFHAGAVTAGWKKAMERALGRADLVVGESKSVLGGKATPHGRLALKLFQGHSRQAAEARGYALPWGPIGNLGVKRALFEKIGPFAPEAGGAFDMDFCWRAVLAGAAVAYEPKALLRVARANEREKLLREFDAYGQGEAWVQRAYSFLGSVEEQDPMLAGVNASRRLRFHSAASKLSALREPLEEVAAAFGSGLRSGLERPARASELERRLPEEAIGWWSGKKEKTIFVPGKGLTNLKGKPLEIWDAWQGGASEKELDKLFVKLFRATPAEAVMAREDFISSLSSSGSAGSGPEGSSQGTGSSEHGGHHHH